MSKAEIAAAEERRQELAQRSQSNTLQVDRHKALLYDARRNKVSAKSELANEQGVTQQLKAALDETRQRLAERTAERDVVLRELARAEEELEAERKAIAMAKAAKKGLVMGQSALGDVHEELMALSSEEAKKAALEVGGDELPVDLVPAPVTHSAELGVDQEALWSEDPAHPMQDEIRQAFQSGLVLVALQKSLSVRAAEMRESLRQLGFAHDATVRTEELCKVAEGDKKSHGERAADYEKEREQVTAEKELELGNLKKLQADHEDMQKRQAALQDQLGGLDGAVALLREERRAKREELEAARLAYEELTRAHEDVGREVEARQTALQEHPEEAARRTSAAERLAHMAEEQTQKSLEELQQTQEQLISFQHAKRALQQAYALLGEQLAAEKKAYSSLQAKHNQQDLELAALARNYMAALPPMPGLDKLAEDPGTPAGEPAAAQALREEAERAATGRTPEPLQQPRHLDPTGHAALSAGGRLVLSI